MNEHFTVSCPYCGEEVRVNLEPDVEGDLVEKMFPNLLLAMLL